MVEDKVVLLKNFHQQLVEQSQQFKQTINFILLHLTVNLFSLIGYDTTYGDKVQFLMVAGGGGGGSSHSGGGAVEVAIFIMVAINILFLEALTQLLLAPKGKVEHHQPNNATSGGAATFDTLSAAGGGRGGDFGGTQIPAANSCLNKEGRAVEAGGGGATGAEGNVPDVTPTYPSQGNDGGSSIGCAPKLFFWWRRRSRRRWRKWTMFRRQAAEMAQHPHL